MTIVVCYLFCLCIFKAYIANKRVHSVCFHDKISLECFWVYAADITVKPVLNSHSKIDKTKILMTKFNGSSMKIESIAKSSPRSILQYFGPALRDNWSWKPIFCLFESGLFTPVWLYNIFWTKILGSGLIIYVFVKNKYGVHFILNICSRCNKQTIFFLDKYY